MDAFWETTPRCIVLLLRERRKDVRRAENKSNTPMEGKPKGRAMPLHMLPRPN